MKHPAPAPAVPKLPPDVERLRKAIGKKDAPEFHDLCNALDMSPRKVEALIREAITLGVPVNVEHSHVSLRANLGSYTGQVQRLHLPALRGDEVKIAVVTDTHFGSEYCMREAMAGFIHRAYDEGVRQVLHVGDFLDGMYKHDAPGSQRYVGVDAQARDAMAVLPHLPGLTYHAITGNHDETFTKAAGVSIGPYMQNLFRAAGRPDLNFYGDRGALLNLHGTTIELWHPLSGIGYARDYKMRKHIEAMPSVCKPHLLLIGHWHTYCHIFTRDVQAIACPTFQSGGGSYGKAIGGAPSIGGLILSWQMTEDNTMREFAIKACWSYEHELVQSVEVA